MTFFDGFEFNKIRYGWNNRNLYRLPYTAENERFYALHKIVPRQKGVTTVFQIQGKQRTIGWCKSRTIGVVWEVNNRNNKHIP